MKRGWLFSVLLLTFMYSLAFVNASSDVVQHNITFDGKKYTIEMLSLDSNSITIKVNNNIKIISPEQTSSPYYVTKFNDLYFVVTYAHESSTLNTLNATLLVGIEKNFFLNESVTDDFQSIEMDGRKYNITLIIANDDSATIKAVDNIGGAKTITINEQLSQPYGMASITHKLGDISYFVLTYARENTALNALNSTVITFFRSDFFIDGSQPASCTENWTCTDWSECIYGEKDRECTDSNACGTVANKPVESQSCTIPTPTPLPSCTNECNVSNQKLCLNQNTYKNCGNYDSDSCLEWGNVSQCNLGEVCNNNICISNAVNDKECEVIGLRENGKYCSLRYTLISQKTETISCQNNFECINNLCLTGKCALQKKTNLVYWVIGIVVVLIVIVFFLFRMITSNKVEA
ncbi:MAG: hypothetical protein Q7R87_02440 [Nanoarchaeota archaeon]|nr:hypothetical protein [Nanoarchaeota archaeon]